jgi:lysyl-tRNA synthetase class I
MTEQNPNTPATIPEQPDAKPPLKKSMPVVIALVAILAILGIANVTSLLRGNKRTAPTSALPMRPASPSAQQVSSFETQQQLQAQHDAEEKQRQQELLAAMQQLQSSETPGTATFRQRNQLLCRAHWTTMNSASIRRRWRRNRQSQKQSKRAPKPFKADFRWETDYAENLESTFRRQAGKLPQAGIHFAGPKLLEPGPDRAGRLARSACREIRPCRGSQRR